MRKFQSGAVRSSAKGKIDWLGARHPLVEKSFGEYMKRHTKTEDGGTRDFNNWWSGWKPEISIQSMLRHVQDLECLHAGLFVYKVKLEDGEDTVVMPFKKDKLPSNWRQVDREECYNAIRFNATAGLLRHLNN